MYAFFTRELWGREGGFISAVAYLVAPYHIVDLYVRTAAAETASFVFLPLILWSFYKLQQTSHRRYIVFSALSSAGLLLTHNCVSVIFFPWVPFYILLLCWPYTSHSRRVSLLHSFLALALGVGVAAFFWLPAFVEKEFVHIELLNQGQLNFNENFIYLKDLILPALHNNMIYFGNAHFFCRGGLVHGLVVLTALLGFKKIAWQEPRLRKQMLFFVVVLIGTIFLTLSSSAIIWEHIRVLQYLQFPFRLLTISMFALSVIAGGVVLLFRQEHRLIAAFIVSSVIFLANFFNCHPRDTFTCDLRLANSDPDKFLSQLVIEDGGEYIPIGVQGGVNGLPQGMPSQKLQALSGGGQVVDTKEISPLRYKFKVHAQHFSSFCFCNFYFPGWTVKVDGRETNILKDNLLGLIVFECPEGSHDVEIYFGTTQLRQIAQGITIASLILLGLVLIFSF